MSSRSFFLAMSACTAVWVAVFVQLPRAHTHAVSVRSERPNKASTRFSFGMLRSYQAHRAQGKMRAAYVRELPALMDMLALGLSAGLSFDSALDLYLGQYNTHLADAFSRARLRWRMGIVSRTTALEELGRASQTRSLERFCTTIVEALSLGAPLADTLNHQATLIREDRRRQVEEEIERTPVKMLIPLGTLIVPAMLLAILGPILSSAFNTF